MVRGIAQQLAKKYINWRGWHTSRKLLVIESDDWGTIRMPSKQVFSQLSAKNPLIAKDAFALYDTLANQDDLEHLFGVLSKFKDVKGNHPVITANTILANPDFDKIKAAGFTDYFYEPFYETIARTSGQSTLELWKEGYKKRLFVPELHGREHLHVPAWLRELKAGNQDLLAAFSSECFAIPYQSQYFNKRRNLLAAFDYHGIDNESDFQGKAVEEAAAIFRDYFGYSATSFIATAYIWDRKLEDALNRAEIQSIQGLALQYQPKIKRFRKKLHFTGQQNKNGQYYTVRNCFFEPTPQPGKDWVNTTLQQIEAAFSSSQPAIMSSHRLNFIGGLEEKNRTQNLKLFVELLGAVLKKWPEVEFMSSAALLNIIEGNDSPY